MKRHSPTPFRATLVGLAALACAVVLLACSAEVPAGTVRYESDSAVVNVGMLVHGYEWGNQVSDVVSPVEVRDADVPELSMEGSAELRASFSADVETAEVTRYAGDDPEGEPVDSTVESGAVTFEAEPGWRYLVTARFARGEAGYLFDATGPAAGTAGATNAAGDFTSTAMVVPLSDGRTLFVDQETGSPYFPTLPEGAPELAAGNVVRVTGNGIMLESYPAQYPGISRVEIVEEGSPEDAERYADLVAQLDASRDPADPPSAAVEYQTELASVTLTPLTCGYTWSYDSEGMRGTVSADAPHPTQLEAADVPCATVDGPTKVTVRFDVPATAAGVVRWREDELAEAARAAGSAAAVELGAVDEDVLSVNDREVADGAVTLTVEPGWRYSVETWFDDGTAVYVFTVAA